MSSIRRITSGPGYCWFGYYDKRQFDPSGRYGLAMRVGFEHRSPRRDDVIEIGLIDLHENNLWRRLGESRAWCWQQGCMLQWRPGSEDEVIWNDREVDHSICHILNVHTGDKRSLAQPIYTLSPDGRTALGTDFRRINDMRPGYGYAGLDDPYADDPAPRDSGIYWMDLESGNHRQIISIADIVAIRHSRIDWGNAKHYFNHLLFNPDGSRFSFLHRWRVGDGPFLTRLFTAEPDGRDVRLVTDAQIVSHFFWHDPQHILVFADVKPGRNAFYLINEATGEYALPLDNPNNGHCSYLPGGEWILNDTYPLGPQRIQHLYVYHVPTGRRAPLGDFHAPPQYEGEWRCDLHPRLGPDAQTLAIDSAHGGDGRQIYLIDIAHVLTAQ